MYISQYFSNVYTTSNFFIQRPWSDSSTRRDRVTHSISGLSQYWFMSHGWRQVHHCQLYTPGPQISQIVTAFTWQQTPFSTNQNTGVRFTNHFPALTHWARDEMNNISQTTFSKVFSSIKMFEFRLKFHWNLFPMVQLTLFQHWFR